MDDAIANTNDKCKIAFGDIVVEKESNIQTGIIYVQCNFYPVAIFSINSSASTKPAVGCIRPNTKIAIGEVSWEDNAVKISNVSITVQPTYHQYCVLGY